MLSNRMMRLNLMSGYKIKTKRHLAASRLQTPILMHRFSHSHFFSSFLVLVSHKRDLFRNYLKQVREETSGRLMGRIYRPNGTPNKWWLAFAQKKFMNIMLPF
ncbi:hypothetical protein O6H91_08G112700 [Diphasiastrum complanatum]|uniref:Uncharacterized protein n=1 Tax=Diphasiastrum complanatum TaxID=34168 RepID=A0ACC2D122_DIPCM|nr:hypothetical protein O6H91_08G112700 [Diphasiastrum complanatum]